MIGTVHHLFPTDAGIEADLERCYGSARPTVDDRPWVGLVMIASLDGSTAVDGLSGELGNDNDRAVFRTLRATADVILVGAKTAAAEGYRPTARPEQRIGVVSASGRIDTSRELFTSGCGFLVLPEDAPEVSATVESIRAGRRAVDVGAALRRIPDLVPAARFVLAEGGPRLNGALHDAGCLDELDLTIAPALVGGDSSRIVAGAGEAVRSLRLAHVLADDEGYLFTRWVRPG